MKGMLYTGARGVVFLVLAVEKSRDPRHTCHEVVFYNFERKSICVASFPLFSFSNKLVIS